MRKTKSDRTKKSWKYYLSIVIIATTLLTGCGTSQGSQTESAVVDTAESVAYTTATTSQVVVDTEFTASDLDVGYEDSTATHITFDGSSTEVSGDGATFEDSVLTISDEGTYVITGTLSDGQLVVDAEDTDKVQIVLNGVSITCSDNAPIYIKNADKTFITLGENTENSLTDGAEYVQTDDNTVDGVIFSKADLTINGDGILNITGNYKHGIATKDELVITGGSFNITAVKDTINSNDCVKIKDGTFNLSATTGNGIQSKNGEDATKGYVYICGGTITVSNCMEGIEGTVIIIEEGTIDVTAEDDGFNASSGNSNTTETTTETTTTEAEAIKLTNTTSTASRSINIANESTEVAADTTTSATTKVTGDDTTGTKVPREFGQGGFGGGGENAFAADTNCYISITGGTVTIDALGDGIDSNGSLYISGGTTYVSGPTNSGNGGLDYNGTAEITGGTIVIAGSTGMAQGFTDSSTQYSLLYNLTTTCEAGTEVKLTDQDGNVVVAYTPNKQYQSVVISTPDLTKDATYTLICGEQTAEIALSSVVTSNGQEGMGGQGMGGQGGRGGQGGQPDQNGMERPEAGNATESTETAESK